MKDSPSAILDTGPVSTLLAVHSSILSPVKQPPKETFKSPSTGVPGLCNPKSARFQMIMLLMGVVFVNTLIRNTMSMGIVCMVKNDTATVKKKNETVMNEECGNTIDEDIKYEGPFEWDSREKGFAISAIFLGGLFTAIPLGYVSDRYSPKRIIEICLLVSTICCVFTPLGAIVGDLPAVFVLRFMMGFGGQATIFPAASSMTSRWIPPNERSTAMALFTTGAQLGMIVAGPFNAFLCQQIGLFDGWRGIFYFNGLSVLPVLLAWFLLAADTPEQYRWIEKTELEYIRDSLSKQHLKKRRLKWSEIPWKRMLFSLPLLVTFVSNLALTAMLTTLQSYIPLYFKQSLRLNLRSNGFLSALPFLTQVLGKISSPVADRLRSSGMVSATWTCKIFNTIGTIGCAVFLVTASYMTCAQTVQAITCLAISSALFSFQLSGFLTSLLTMAPAYTGIVNSLSRFCGQIGAVMSPLLVGPMTPEGTASEWRNVFWLMSLIMILAGVLFLAFGSAEIQNWAKLEDESDSSGREDSENESC